MLQSDDSSLWNLLGAAGRLSERFLWAAQAKVALGDLLRGSSLDGKLENLRGRHVILATKDQLPTALALIELDGVARRIIVCPPDFRAEHLSAVTAAAHVNALT